MESLFQGFLSRGWGQDSINNYDDSTGKVDAIEFAADIAPSDLIVTSWERDLVLSLKGTTDKITVNNYFSGDGVGSWKLEKIRFADGTVWTFDQVKIKSLQVTDGDDNLTGYITDDVLNGGLGNDSIFGLEGNDRLEGGAGNDYLVGDEGNDSLLGGAGNDYLYGHVGNDTLDGGTGNDNLDGGAGNDVYLFGRGSGQDIISSQDVTSGKRDIVQFSADVSPGDLIVGRQNENLIILVRGTSDRLTVQYYFNKSELSSYGLEAIEFADGTAWDYAAVSAMPLIPMLLGTDCDDYLSGGSSSEVLDGGAGNDYLGAGDGDNYLSGGDGRDSLIAGDGNDYLSGDAGDDFLVGGGGINTYYFGRGSGSDSIYNGNAAADKQDIIRFADDISVADIEVSLERDDLLLTIRDTGEQLRIIHCFYIVGGLSPYGIDKIQFGDGVLWDFEAVLSKLAPTDGADYLRGTSTSNYLQGLAGNDWLFGEGGDDTLDGGAGDDYLRGGLGNDTFLFGRGSGQDHISSSIANFDNAPGKQDVIRFAAGVAASDIEVSRNWYDLCLTIRDTGDQLQVAGYFFTEEDGPRIIVSAP